MRKTVGCTEGDEASMSSTLVDRGRGGSKLPRCCHKALSSSHNCPSPLRFTAVNFGRLRGSVPNIPKVPSPIHEDSEDGDHRPRTTH